MLQLLTYILSHTKNLDTSQLTPFSKKIFSLFLLLVDFHVLNLLVLRS